MDPIVKLIEGLAAELGDEIGECKPYDPYDGQFELFTSDHCTFEVLDGGVWYKVDASHPYPNLYRDAGVDVPDIVLERVGKCVDRVTDGESRYGVPGWSDDRSPYYEKELRDEFDDVRFVDCNIPWGAVF